MSIKTFIFLRLEDISGVSGTGVVAEGCVFGNGETVVHWLGEHGSVNVYHSLDDVIFVHSHGNKTKIVFDD